MMKKLYILLAVITLLSVAAAAVCIVIMPARVPVHYNASGEVDRIGSKYFFALFPAIVAVNGIAISAAAKQERKKGGNSNEKALLITGVLTGILFTGLGIFFMVQGIKYNGGSSAALSPGDTNKFIGIGIGVMFAVLGNIMPKVRRNSAIGVRTKWSIANDSVWQKTQRYGGRVMVAAGLAAIILSLFVPGIYNTFMLTGIITVSIILCTVKSRRYYIEETEKSKEK